MPIIRFTDNYGWKAQHRPRMVRSYKRGWQGQVQQKCADAALMAGKAVMVQEDPPFAKVRVRRKKVEDVLG